MWQWRMHLCSSERTYSGVKALVKALFRGLGELNSVEYHILWISLLLTSQPILAMRPF